MTLSSTKLYKVNWSVWKISLHCDGIFIFHEILPGLVNKFAFWQTFFIQLLENFLTQKCTLSPSRGSRGFTPFCLSSFFTNAKLHSFTDQRVFKYFSINFINLRGVVVITSVYQPQGPQFDPRQTQYILYRPQCRIW